MNKYVKYMILFCCILIISYFSFCVLTDKDIIFDSAVYDFVSNFFISESMTPFVSFITWFGSVMGIIVVSIIVFLIFRDKKIIVSVSSLMIISTILNSVLKLIFARIRPNINPMVMETSYSFPSGHSMACIVLYGFIIYLVYNHVDRKSVKYGIILLLSILIILVGFSRIYLGVHYFSDVIGGFVFGILYLFVYINVMKKVIKKI